MQRERWHGTLELLVAAPTHFALVLLPVTIAMSTIGLYSMVATLVWGRFAFGIDVPLEHPLAFALALVATSSRSARSASCSRSRSSATGPRGRSGTCSSTRSGSSAASSSRSRSSPDWVRPISWAARADLGRRARSARRRSAATPRPDDRHVRRARRRVLAAGVLVLEPRPPRARASDGVALARVTSSAHLLRRRADRASARSSASCARGSSSRACSSRRSSRSCSSSTSAARRGSSRTSST